jgi:hypothetical protein
MAVEEIVKITDKTGDFKVEINLVTGKVSASGYGSPFGMVELIKEFEDWCECNKDRKIVNDMGNYWSQLSK